MIHAEKSTAQHSIQMLVLQQLLFRILLLSGTDECWIVFLFCFASQKLGNFRGGQQNSSSSDPSNN